MSLTAKILICIWLHFIGDFLFQSDKIVTEKVHNFNALLLHCLYYSACFLLFGFKFVLIVYFSHLMIDFIMTRFRNPENRHWFFVGLGFDQALHISILIILCDLQKKGLL